LSREADTWLADAARAFAALRPGDDATRAAIARLLGLAAPTATSRLASGPAAGDQGRPSSRTLGPGGTAGQAPEPAEASRSLDRLPLLEPVGREAADVTSWSPGESMPRVTAEHLAAVPSYDPLFAPRSAVSVIHALLAQDARDGPVDVAALVDTVARLRPIREIPHERRLTLRFGAQLLLDVGEGMEPFARDEEMFADQVQRVTGTATPVGYFADCPLRGTGSGSISSWDRYRPPHAGTPVLVVSDFGIGGPLLYPQRSRLEEWARFAQLLAEAGCPVAGLVPYPPARWPADLARLIPLLTWDRGTTVGAVMARIR